MSQTSVRREVLMPPVTPQMADGRIQRWFVSEGQRVAPGDVLVEVATASATLELEAEKEGEIERILVPAGTTGVKVNTPIALFAAAELPGAVAQSVETALVGAQQSMLGLLHAASDGGSPLPIETSPIDKPLIATSPMVTAAPVIVQTYREALRDALAEEMRRNPAVFVMGTDLAQNRGAQKVTQGLLDEFGAGRVVSVPPLEDAYLHLAVGAALNALVPVVELAAWGKTLEGLLAALSAAAETRYLTGGSVGVPLVLRGPNGWAAGQVGNGARCVAALLAAVPGLKVVAPATPETAKSLLKAAIRDGGPVALLEHELLYAVKGEVGGTHAWRIGEARTARAGRDITFVAFGRAVVTALAAADELMAAGVSAEVVDLMTVRPIDHATIAASVARTGRLMVIEEGTGECGIGAEVVAEATARVFHAMTAAPVRVSGSSVPMPYADALQAVAIPNAKRVAERALDALKTP